LKNVHSIQEIAKNQNKIETFLNAKKSIITQSRKQLIDKLIIDFIINKMSPLDVVEDDFFRKLINFFEPHYQFMSCKSLRAKISNMFEEKKNEIMAKLDELETISIDFDTWTSIANQSYITVNCHALTNDWELLCFNLETNLIEESHCSLYLKKLIDEILDNFDLEFKTKFCIHDNAANMNLIVELLGVQDIRCFAHTWDLALKEALNCSETLKSIIGKCHKIVGHFNHSSTAETAFKKEQQRIGSTNITLKLDIETRWGSVYHMLNSIVENKLCLISSFDKIISNNSRKENMKKMVLNTNEWLIIESLIPSFDSIDAVYRLMSGENYCTISFVYPTIMKFLNEHLISKETDLIEVKEFKVRFRQEIESRFTPCDESIANSPAIVSYILNPQFKEGLHLDKKMKKSLLMKSENK